MHCVSWMAQSRFWLRDDPGRLASFASAYDQGPSWMQGTTYLRFLGLLRIPTRIHPDIFFFVLPFPICLKVALEPKLLHPILSVPSIPDSRRNPLNS